MTVGNQGISKMDFGISGVWVSKATFVPYPFNREATCAKGLHTDIDSLQYVHGDMNAIVLSI